MQNDILSTLSTRKDLYVTSLPLESKRPTREAIALHALNHVSKYVTKSFFLFFSLSHHPSESAAGSSRTTNASPSTQKTTPMHLPSKTSKTKASPVPLCLSSFPSVPSPSTGFVPSPHIPLHRHTKSKISLASSQNTACRKALLTSWLWRSLGRTRPTM